MRGLALIIWIMAGAAGAADFARLAGHGGPVKGVAISADGRQALTASFDYALGHWALPDGAELRRLTGHRAAVNTAAFLPDGRAATGGDDFDIRLWDLETGGSEVLSGHKGKVMALAVSPDGAYLASAGWDGWIGLWDLGTGRLIRMLKGHQSNVTDVTFAETGRVIYSASTDGTIRKWDRASGQELHRLVDHGFGINTILIDEAAGWLAYGGLDGGTRVLDLETGAILADLTLDRRPILAMAQSPDASQIAVGDGEGFIMVVATGTWAIIRDFRAAKRGPIWALAYTADNAGLLAGGLDDAAYLWPLDAPRPPLMASGERSFLNDPRKMDNGARQFYRKCSICHTLTPDDARRAGPTLWGVFGRPAGSLANYPYSPAMAEAGIIWTDETIGKLFEIGPDFYTPGSKMPMQRITQEQDRRDLIAFLRAHTGATTDQGGAPQ